MSKKIQVSTVKQMADVEVVFVNSNLISKAIRASIAAKEIIESMKGRGCISTVIQHDEEGAPIMDENGMTVPQLDEKGNLIYDYNYFSMDNHLVEQFHTQIAPFIEELVDAFEE